MTMTTQIADRIKRRTLPPPQVARAVRISAGATQDEVAEEVGVDRATVARWESGDRSPSRRHAELYAAVLRDLQSLLEGE